LILSPFGVEREQIPGIWGTFSFTVGLVIILIILYPEIKSPNERLGRVLGGGAVMWSIAGVFLAYLSQVIAVSIEMLLGIQPGSENTELIVEIAEATPLFMIVVAVVAPILEEIIFRKVIFGSLYKKYNFFISAFISALAFALVHLDYTHLIIYFAMGVTFSYLYVKTKRLLVPIVAHVAMNSLVLLVQVIFADEIIEMQRQLEQTQFIIGGLN
jgi:membrane protease YdiL (CAAX protease family)